jgi:hypothetical protein
MNLFSQMDALLDENDKPRYWGLRSNRQEAERLVCKMTRLFARAQQAAVRLVAVERSAFHELIRQRQRVSVNRLMVERLEEEHARAKRFKDAVLHSLRELGEGLEHARLLRDTIRRWADVHEESKWKRRWRQFWRAYHRLGDLADAQLDRTPALYNKSH